MVILFLAGFLTLGFLQATPAYAVAPTLSVKNARVTETDSVSTTAVVRVELSRPVPRRVTAEYTTVNGTAKAGLDYVRQAGTVVFPRYTQVARIRVTVLGDELDERNEAFRVRISDAFRASIDDAVGRVRILDNDPAPYLSAGDVTVTEPADGVAVAKFPVSLSEPSGRYIEVDFSLSAGSATLDKDFYVGEDTGTVVFPPGVTTRHVSFVVMSDSVVEGTETVYLTLSDAVNASVADGFAVASIVEDLLPKLTITDVTVTEGASATFTITKSKDWSQTIQVYYRTSDNTAKSGSDYYSAAGYETLDAGEMTETFTVSTINDTVSESTETFYVTLSNPVNATIADATGVGTILDNDALTVSVGNASAEEGNTAWVPITLSRTSTSKVTVDYATSSGTALSGTDFSRASGTATIAAGSLSTSVPVTTIEDTADEQNETFTMTISNAKGAVLGTRTGVVTIQDDDPSAAPTISVRDDKVDEGGKAYFEVYLSRASTQDVRFDYTTLSGTATEGTDYTDATAYNVTIPAGTLSVDVVVQTTEDTLDEVDETFYLDLSDVEHAVAGDLRGLGTIIDDDVAPEVAVTGPTADVDEGKDAVFTVSLTPVSGRTVTVAWTTADGTAKAAEDYTAASGTLTFAPGEASKTVTVTTVDDKTEEDDETFTVVLSSPTNATLGTASAPATIAANDAA